MNRKKKMLCSTFALLLLMNVLPNRITIIDKQSFYGCVNLKSIINTVDVILNYVSAYYGLPEIILLALLVFICIYVVRSILILFKLNNYKKYSKQVFNDMSISKQNEQIINYNPIHFIQDKLLSIFSKVIITLAAFTYIIFLFYISMTNIWKTTPFLNTIICILGTVLVSIAIIALIVWLSYKIRSIISQHKEADIAKIKIRKINGVKKDDQYNI